MPPPETNDARRRPVSDGSWPPSGLAPEQIDRWADRIAGGGDAFPADLADPDRTQLAEAVRRRLRDRLVRLVAGAVAWDLARPASKLKEE